jgi:hypothetical protein
LCGWVLFGLFPSDELFSEEPALQALEALTSNEAAETAAPMEPDDEPNVPGKRIFAFP